MNVLPTVEQGLLNRIIAGLTSRKGMWYGGVMAGTASSPSPTKEVMMIGALLVVVAAQSAGMPEIDRVFQQPTFVLVLGTQQGDCPDGEKRAAYAGQGKVVPGCWFERDETVWLVWGDGDRSAIPSAMFHKPPEA